MRSRILVGLIAGGLGGLVGGLITEAIIPYNSYVHLVNGVCTADARTPAWPANLVAFCVYGLIGLLLGSVDGIVEGNPRKIMRGLFIGALAGIVFGRMISVFGDLLYGTLGGSKSAVTDPSIFAFMRQIIARAVQMGSIGLGLGIGAGISTLNPKRVWYGAIGGVLGGFLGGIIFDLVAKSLNPVQSALGTNGCYDAGGPPRMISYVLIGALTGLFIGLVEELLKQAWVKVLAGRNEGKDYILSKNMNLMGRDERCDVPLYGDMNVAVQHVAIRADGNRHVLIDGKTPVGTLVNGVRVASGGEQLLRDGDMIQVGTHRILFREKATASKFARKPVDEPKTKPGGSIVPMPSHLCEFCGSPKDPGGNCLCNPVGGAANPGAGLAALGSAPAFNAGPGYNPSPGFQPDSGFGGGMVSGGTRLIGLEGPYMGQVFPVGGPNVILGREMTCNIALTADTTISRSHARIANEGGALVLYDNGSSNGTFVNGQRVTTSVVLAPGDIVQFGASKFHLE